jgi:hypothetical protein
MTQKDQTKSNAKILKNIKVAFNLQDHSDKELIGLLQNIIDSNFDNIVENGIAKSGNDNPNLSNGPDKKQEKTKNYKKVTYQ